MPTTTFDENERSASQSRPIDLYTIVTPTATYHVTSYARDINYLGQGYTALTMERSDQDISQDATGRELTIRLPVSHGLVQSYASSGIPPRSVSVRVTRLQELSGEAQQDGFGFVQSLAMDGPHVAILRVPSLTDDAIKVKLPILSASRTCQHILFDRGCTPSSVDGPQRASFTAVASVVSQVGVTLTVNTLSGYPDQWKQFGEVVHTATGERRTILSQVGSVLTINAPFVGLTVGDGVTVFAGCNHSVLDHCGSKFGNVRNFGGHPFVTQVINPWTPAGLGVITQV